MSSISTTDAAGPQAPASRLQQLMLMCAMGVPGAMLIVGTAALLVALPFGVDPLWHVEPITLPEAAALHDNGEVVRLIRLGADPSEAGSVRADVIDNETHVLTPLEAAVAAERADVVELLLDNGAAIDDRIWIRLVCFADVVDAPDVRTALEARRPAAAAAACDGVQTPW